MPVGSEPPPPSPAPHETDLGVSSPYHVSRVHPGEPYRRPVDERPGVRAEVEYVYLIADPQDDAVVRTDHVVIQVDEVVGAASDGDRLKSQRQREAPVSGLDVQRRRAHIDTLDISHA